ncbi:MAG: HPr family phosphocarrier protein [Gammaproteobacteria bacterium]|nr:HPr family phosphocarrier protein [Gammaproteobacteria bacterium]
MLRKTVTIINKLGLHARASAKFVKTAGRFTAEIKIHYDGKTVDGKSIMGIMMLAASKGTELEITAEGDDATDAINAITALINNRFDEAE